MGKIYCEKCGHKIYDTKDEFCPRCGTRLQSYREVQKAGRNKKIRNTILILLIIAGIVIAGVFAYQYFFNQQYQTVQISNATSLEMPVGKGINSTELDGYIHQITNNAGVTIYTYNSQDKSMSGAIAFSEMKTQAVNNPHNDNQIVEHEENGKTVYSITYRNNNTHDNIIITAESRDVAQRIFDSIQVDNSTMENNGTGGTGNSSSTSNSNGNMDGKTPYAYGDDGVTPLWTKADYERYVMDKGGYSSMDEYYAGQSQASAPQSPAQSSYEGEELSVSPAQLAS